MNGPSVRDTMGGYGTGTRRVRMLTRANTAVGDRDKDALVDVEPFEAERLTRIGVAEWADLPEPGRRSSRRTSRKLVESDATRSVVGDQTNLVEPS